MAVLDLHRCMGLSLDAVASLIEEQRLQSMWAQWLQLPGSRGQAQELCMSLAAPRQVASSQTKDGARVSCPGRRILNHGATREALLPEHFTQI